jgi:hypothetical protein
MSGQKAQSGSRASQPSPRTVAFTTGLPWHISSGKRDRQLLNTFEKERENRSHKGRLVPGGVLHAA